MNIVEMWDKAKECFEKYKGEYDYVAIRFEDKSRNIGDICGNSKHNVDREDEREFPSYGTKEYEAMIELDGTSSWDLSSKYVYRIEDWQDKEDDCRNYFLAEHCYIVVGNNLGKNYDYILDPDEICIKDAEIVEIIF